MRRISLARLERHLYSAADRLRQEGLDAATYKDSHDAATEAEEKELAKLHHLKSGLMTDLLTGRVRVPNEKGN
jgi:hypothetical protein